MTMSHRSGIAHDTMAASITMWLDALSFLLDLKAGGGADGRLIINPCPVGATGPLSRGTGRKRLCRVSARYRSKCGRRRARKLSGPRRSHSIFIGATSGGERPGSS
jgi:hypothetical protein